MNSSEDGVVSKIVVGAESEGKSQHNIRGQNCREHSEKLSHCVSNEVELNMRDPSVITCSLLTASQMSRVA